MQTSDARQRAGSAADWQDHEHNSETTRHLAAQLVRYAGSSELAKHAIDAVGETDSEGSQKEWFAHTCGFESYDELKAAAIPVESLDAKQWLAVAQEGDGWIVWCDGETSSPRRCESLEEACAAAAMSAAGTFGAR